MSATVLVLAVVVGLSLGLLGGGGSILTVPLLVYVAGQDAKTAIATSLLVVGVTSAAGAVAHARAGRVAWRTAVVFGGAGMAGAFVGGRLGALVDGTLLLIAFAVMMAVTSVAMLRDRPAPEPPAGGELHVGKAVAEGLAVGLVTGAVGAGGGFLVVPALVLLGGLPMEVAVGTSLVVIAMKSAAGFAGYAGSIQLDWPLVIGVTTAAVLGSIVGGRLAGRVPAGQLRRAFGWFVAAMSVFVLVQELDPAPLLDLARTRPGWTIVGVAGLLVTARLGIRAWRRRGETADAPATGTADDQPQVPAAPMTTDHD